MIVLEKPVAAQARRRHIAIVREIGATG